MYSLFKCSQAQSDLPWPLALRFPFWQLSLPSSVLRPCACSFELQLPGIGTDPVNIPRCLTQHPSLKPCFRVPHTGVEGHSPHL